MFADRERERGRVSTGLAKKSHEALVSVLRMLSLQLYYCCEFKSSRLCADELRYQQAALLIWVKL